MSSNRKKSIGVFAGIFDPVHLGHIAAVQSALDRGLVDKVVVIAERRPIHKPHTESYSDRLAMLKLAFRDEPKVEILDFKHDDHYIKPFFEELNSLYPDSRFVWIMGADVAQKVEQWKNADQLASLNVSSIACFNREGSDLITEKIAGVDVVQINNSKPSACSRKFRADTKGNADLLDSEVGKYITKNNLYSKFIQ